MNKNVAQTTGLALVLAALVTPGISAAGQPSPTSLIDRLPKTAKITLPTSTSSIPKSIPASEKVDGFYTEIPEHLKRQADPYRYVMVSGSKEASEARSRGTQLPGAPTCFTAAYPSGGTEVNWSGSLSTSTTVQNYAKQNYGYGGQYGSVQLVRSERIVKETADKLTFEVKVAYVDAETLGARLVSSFTSEFSLVKELPGNLKVWGTKSDEQVTFLVRREKHEKERFHFGSLTVMTNGSHSMSSSEGCPVTFNLKTGKGVAASAIVQTETVLEIKGTNDDEEKPGVLSLHGALPAFGQNEARVRPVRIGFSSTWMSKDTKPVVTVSHGWAGKERTQPI